MGEVCEVGSLCERDDTFVLDEVLFEMKCGELAEIG